MRTILTLAAALLLAACATRTDLAPAETVPLEQRERELARAMVRRDLAMLDELHAEEFDCAFVTYDGKTIPAIKKRAARSAVACTGLGHRLSRHDTSWQQRVEEFAPRVISIDSIDVQRENGTATVVMQHSYRNWVPGDAGMVRRSRVTDKWVLRDGQWRIVHRLSEAL